MCYTSSALSFMLEDLGKTVVRVHLPLFTNPGAERNEDPDRCSDSSFPTTQ